MRLRIVSFHRRGVVVRRWFRRGKFAIFYGEILTVERRRGGSGLILHTRTVGDVRIAGLRGRERDTEDEFRVRGVRIVDCWGAIIAPTVEDFADALAQKPTLMRQLSDDA